MKNGWFASAYRSVALLTELAVLNQGGLTAEHLLPQDPENSFDIFVYGFESAGLPTLAGQSHQEGNGLAAGAVMRNHAPRHTQRFGGQV